VSHPPVSQSAPQSAPQPALGIDIAKQSFHAALWRDGGIVADRQFANDETGFARLTAWLEPLLAGSAHATVHACLEATGRYGRALHGYLYAQGHTVSVVNPQRTHNYAKSLMRRTKSDKVDAHTIALFCAQQRPRPTPPLNPERQQLQELTRRLADLKAERQRERNRLAAGLDTETVRRDITDNLARLEERIRQLEAEAQRLAESHPTLADDVRLLRSIKGLGLTTALILVAEIPDVHAFARVSHLVAYAGLNPTQESSGSSVRRKSRLSKQGNKHIRAALYMPILVAIRCNPLLKTLAERLRAKGRHAMAINGAAMRKMLHLVYGVLKTRTLFDPDHAAQTARTT
jgi:transposase